MSFEKFEKLIYVLIVVFIVVFLLWAFTPLGRLAVNERMYEIQKVDDATRYKTRKTVEDTCRAMISSYTSDSLIYEQYKDSDNPEKQSWGEQAKIRANKTAASYNEFVLKNSFVWEGNVPKDIKSELEYIR